jgi:hypothetical protein
MRQALARAVMAAARPRAEFPPDERAAVAASWVRFAPGGRREYRSGSLVRA